jgi:hypothetical protein
VKNSIHNSIWIKQIRKMVLKLNLKSNILKIGVAIALILMLIPVIAAEDIDSTVTTDSADGNAEIITDDIGTPEGADGDTGDGDGSEDTTDGETLSEEPTDETTPEENGENTDYTANINAAGAPPSADLEVVVIPSASKVNVGDIVAFAIGVRNNGPDTATNVLVRFGGYGDVALAYIFATKGIYDFETGLWYIPELAPGEYAILAFAVEALSDQDIIVFADVISDTPDPDLSNNFDYSIVIVGEEDDTADSSEELPATGNPIALALLAMLSMVGISLKRKL